MIAIPNMDKPKNCMDCIVEEYADCDVWKGVVSASKYKDRRYEHCPLIDIVTCGECICYRGDHNYCYNDYFARENGFCSYGERK